jgi:hypothetical protein
MGHKKGRRVYTCSFTFISFYVSSVANAGRVFYVSLSLFITFSFIEVYVVLCFVFILYSFICISFFIFFRLFLLLVELKKKKILQTATLHVVQVYCLYLLQTAENGRFGICGRGAVHAHLLTYILLPLVTVSY